jgi:uncharacterized protein YcfL
MKTRMLIVMLAVIFSACSTSKNAVVSDKNSVVAVSNA